MRPPTIWLRRDSVSLPTGQVLLTFDDGPNPTAEVTHRLLQTLDRAGVRAAFCVCGSAVDECPSLVAEIHSYGHILVNHTYAHRITDLFRVKALQHEIQRCDHAIANALGMRDYRSRFFRPPGGLFTPAVNRILAEVPLELLPITFYAWDTCSDSAHSNRVIHRTVSAAIRDRGGVFVLHDGLLDCYPWATNSLSIWRKGLDRIWIPDAVASIIDHVRRAGSEFADPLQLPVPFVRQNQM